MISDPALLWSDSGSPGSQTRPRPESVNYLLVIYLSHSLNHTWGIGDHTQELSFPSCIIEDGVTCHPCHNDQHSVSWVLKHPLEHHQDDHWSQIRIWSCIWPQGVDVRGVFSATFHQWLPSPACPPVLYRCTLTVHVYTDCPAMCTDIVRV